MVVLLLLVLGATEPAAEFVPVTLGGKGTGFAIWGDAGADELIARIFPTPTQEMKTDTLRTFSVLAALRIGRSGAVVSEPQLLEHSGVPAWDSIALKALRGWVFEPCTLQTRLDTVRIQFRAYTKPATKDSVPQENIRERINPAVFTTVEEILEETPDTIASSGQNPTPIGITFTFTGEVDENDLQSHLLPDLEAKMAEKGITSAAARFEITIEASGWIQDVTVAQSSGKTFIDAELEKAMMQWRFRPSYRTERRAEVIFVISFE